MGNAKFSSRTSVDVEDRRTAGASALWRRPFRNATKAWTCAVWWFEAIPDQENQILTEMMVTYDARGSPCVGWGFARGLATPGPTAGWERCAH